MDNKLLFSFFILPVCLVSKDDFAITTCPKIHVENGEAIIDYDRSYMKVSCNQGFHIDGNRYPWIKCIDHMQTNIICEDLNECEQDPCENIGTCYNTKGSFICECGKDWSGKICSCAHNDKSCDCDLQRNVTEILTQALDKERTKVYKLQQKIKLLEEKEFAKCDTSIYRDIMIVSLLLTVGLIAFIVYSWRTMIGRFIERIRSHWTQTQRSPNSNNASFELREKRNQGDNNTVTVDLSLPINDDDEGKFRDVHPTIDGGEQEGFTSTSRDKELSKKINDRNKKLPSPALNMDKPT